MKEIIEMSKESRRILTGIWAIFIVAFGAYFAVKWFGHQRELNEFIKMKVNSPILDLKNMHRGFYLVQLKVNDRVMDIDLPIDFEVKKYNICVGDSMAKDRNSVNARILKTLNNGHIKEVCTLAISY